MRSPLEWLAGVREHGRARARLALLASGALEDPARGETLDHLDRCRGCREEHEELRVVVTAIEQDPVRAEEPELPLDVLVARVEQALERAVRPRPLRRRAWLVALPAAAAALALALAVPKLVERSRSGAPVARAEIPPSEATPLVSEDALRRIERNLAREQAVRYLSQAGDVLVAVAATGSDCDHGEGRLDVGAAPERSRELLEKRRLVVGAGSEAVASARGVLDDVEMALRDVADLPACVKRRDVERVRRDVERRQLLMRIRLMTRELEG